MKRISVQITITVSKRIQNLCVLVFKHSYPKYVVSKKSGVSKKITSKRIQTYPKLWNRIQNFCVRTYPHVFKFLNPHPQSSGSLYIYVRAMHRVNPLVDRLSLDRIDPLVNRVDPSMDRVGPSVDKVGTSVDRVGPSADRVPSHRVGP